MKVFIYERTFFKLILTVVMTFISFVAFAQIAVKGKVLDEKGLGMPDVNVLLKGTTTVVKTDATGNYKITVPNAQSTLVFSYLSYVTQQIVVNQRTTINVSLAAQDNTLDQVVVVGYGAQKRATITGAVSDIKSDALMRTPAITTSGALVGKIQGVNTRQTDARPGGTTNLQIRNLGSPLYVIDGVPSDAGQFNNLGQNDIESISILKDASAAIYGLRAANGVVLVTTKKGRSNQPTTISVSSYYGLQNFTRMPKPANAGDYVRALAESDQNLNRTSIWTRELLNKWQAGTEPGFQSFDYYDFIIRPNVPQRYLSANASGGSNNTNFFISATHLNQEAVIKDFSFNRTNVQANLDAGLAKGLKIGTQLAARLERRHQTGVPGYDDYFNPLLSLYTNWPTERPYANDNPNYINATHNINVNPATYAEDVSGYADSDWRALKSNFYAQYSFPFGLIAKATYSYNYTTNVGENFEYTYNAYTYDPATNTYNINGGNQNPFRRKERREIEENFGQFQLNYAKSFGEHSFDVVAAYERYDSTDDYIELISNPPNNTVPLMYFADQTALGNTYGVSARAGYIARINYNYKQKYLLEALGRYDGSFLFRKDSRFGFFPGVSAGWIISKEKFFNRIKFVDNLKLRVSYGQTGTDRQPYGNTDDPLIAPFSYLQGYDYANGGAVFNGSLVTGVSPRGLPITNLSWITSISKNIGIDFALFNNKLTGSFDFFERKRTGLPAPRYDILLPSEVGYALPNDNLNSDANRGMEGILTYRSKIREVEYSIGVNATLSRLRTLDYYKPRFGNSWDEYRNSGVDRWADVNFGYHVLGRFHSQDEIDNYAINNDGQGNRTLLPGDLKFEDTNGDGIINYMDQRPIGYAQGGLPYLNVGINGSVTWKGITLQFDFAGASMQTFQREYELQIPFQNNGNSPAYLLNDRWHRADPFNPNSEWISGTYPALRKDNPGLSNFAYRNDFWITNVRYLRLKNLLVGYSLPKKWIESIGFKNVFVYANGTNIFSLDNLKEFEIDPEISSTNGVIYPQQRLFNFGFNLTL
ncbi:SusC/RagA family TonB-linked outer membrane protein [Pedobacter sp. MR22-3]|uniref:SusC/RagA family TonB-linked outer membrane protein n=1 Tax=Pedobacter sp. MR22-3 TaxID=2994552 RepID=UPI002247962F|nr:TonB-dependent receptor [Pedobacter sp. MR22-3]MCX2585724.1 TonB-dependent receptor [Pedobacter sp. MR22-3]